VLPGTSHFELISRAEWIAHLITPFLDTN
jgi:hypothetical protein